MFNSYARIYEVATERFDFRQLVNEFNEGGIFLENPRTGKIVELSETGEIPSDLDSIETHINSRITTPFVWWIDDYHDLFCRIDLQDNIIRQEYGFDYFMEPDQANLTITAFQRRFRRLAVGNLALMMLVDLRKYPSDEIDWDQFLSGKGIIERIDDLPDVLILKSEELARIHLDLVGQSEEFCPGYTRVTREQGDST
ncbi:MAG: hypothetical protein ACLQPD_10790 [Desulfomonilaceae bacterium]